MPLLEAAIEGARLRFRPVMMTSFAFILGLVPLVIATGASKLAFRNVSTPVFGGMLAASLIGIFVIPTLYVTFQAWRERLRPGARPPRKFRRPKSRRQSPTAIDGCGRRYAPARPGARAGPRAGEYQ